MAELGPIAASEQGGGEGRHDQRSDQRPVADELVNAGPVREGGDDQHQPERDEAPALPEEKIVGDGADAVAPLDVVQGDFGHGALRSRSYTNQFVVST